MSTTIATRPLPRNRRQHATVPPGAFAAGTLVRVSGERPYMAAVERSVEGFARVLDLETAQRTETVAERRLEALTGDALADAILLYLNATINADLRSFVMRALAYYGSARLQPCGVVQLGAGDQRVELWLDGELVHAAQLRTYRRHVWVAA